MPDKDFLIVGLDLLGAIVQALGQECQLLLVHRPLEQILKLCMKDETADVRSCAFALLGDEAQHCFGHLISIKPDVHDFIVFGIENLDPRWNQGGNSISAMNNACWALGEVLMRSGEFGALIHPLLSKLVYLLVNTQTQKSVRENCSVTLGRLGFHYTDMVAPFLDQFIQQWYRLDNKVSCVISNQRNSRKTFLIEWNVANDYKESTTTVDLFFYLFGIDIGVYID
jgi:transportin-1